MEQSVSHVSQIRTVAKIILVMRTATVSLAMQTALQHSSIMKMGVLAMIAPKMQHVMVPILLAKRAM